MTCKNCCWTIRRSVVVMVPACLVLVVLMLLSMMVVVLVLVSTTTHHHHTLPFRQSYIHTHYQAAILEHRRRHQELEMELVHKLHRLDDMISRIENSSNSKTEIGSPEVRGWTGMRTLKHAPTLTQDT